MKQIDDLGSVPLPILLGCGLLMAAVLLLDRAFPLGVAIDVLYIAPVLLALRTPWHGFTILIAAICTLLVGLGFLISPPGVVLWKAVFNRAIACGAVWITAILGLQIKVMQDKREEAVREREQALEHVKILRGLLPICANCKKIRNDEGYWTQIEEYISTHSEAMFSHGICPQCMRELYPEFFKKDPESDPS